jgi:hypothetical protein
MESIMFPPGDFKHCSYRSTQIRVSVHSHASHSDPLWTHTVNVTVPFCSPLFNTSRIYTKSGFHRRLNWKVLLRQVVNIYDVSRKRIPSFSGVKQITSRHGVTYLKFWIFISNAVRTSNFALPILHCVSEYADCVAQSLTLEQEQPNLRKVTTNIPLLWKVPIYIIILH